ncbi:UNVERIFIED_CONTAM: putative serine/threonine-protein kinase PBL16 [Sesamum angustifolium]|uniref:Serine/threonine-protein kinase PBL16 n=1 Tax=Sesamum angustifolium TaxID=2727405 RepID=A0AAW2QPM7_9LAMI
MGNCWCAWETSIYRVSSNANQLKAFDLISSSPVESPKQPSPSEAERKAPSKLPSNPEEVEDLRRSTAANPLIAFTFNELKSITENFRQDYMLGGGGFGSVYKGTFLKIYDKDSSRFLLLSRFMMEIIAIKVIGNGWLR